MARAEASWLAATDSAAEDFTFGPGATALGAALGAEVRAGLSGVGTALGSALGLAGDDGDGWGRDGQAGRVGGIGGGDGVARYRDVEWLRHVRRWPPVMIDYLQAFFKLQ